MVQDDIGHGRGLEHDDEVPSISVANTWTEIDKRAALRISRPVGLLGGEIGYMHDPLARQNARGTGTRPMHRAIGLHVVGKSCRDAMYRDCIEVSTVIE